MNKKKFFKLVSLILTALFIISSFPFMCVEAADLAPNIKLTASSTEIKVNIKKPGCKIVKIGYGSTLKKASRSADKAKTHKVKAKKTYNFKLKKLKSGTHYVVCIKMISKNKTRYVYKKITTTLGKVYVEKVTPSDNKQTYDIELTDLKKANYKVFVYGYIYDDDLKSYKNNYSKLYNVKNNKLTIERPDMDMGIIIVRVLATKRVYGKTIYTDGPADTRFYCTKDVLDGTFISDQINIFPKQMQ